MLWPSESTRCCRSTIASKPAELSGFSRPMKDDLIPLHDIRREIEFLNSLRDRTTFESFRSSSTDIRAASYSIMVISEAVRRIPDEWSRTRRGAPSLTPKECANFAACCGDSSAFQKMLWLDRPAFVPGHDFKLTVQLRIRSDTAGAYLIVSSMFAEELIWKKIKFISGYTTWMVGAPSPFSSPNRGRSAWKIAISAILGCVIA